MVQTMIIIELNFTKQSLSAFSSSMTKTTQQLSNQSHNSNELRSDHCGLMSIIAQITIADAD
jgi:hypothetical protein